MIGVLRRSFVAWLPPSWKPSIRSRLRRLRSWYLQQRHPFTEADLLRALRSCGVEEGDVLLVHSSYADFAGFRGGVPEVIRVLETAVGAGGTLLMPTHTTAGSAVAYARQGSVFNPARTPSSVGIITEVFRRRAGVKRSLHPTHSVAGLGAEVDTLLADHYLADTPCGRGTPYHRLIERGGKVVLLNTGIGALTLYHCIEELLEPILPFSPFTSERYVLQIRNGQQTLQSAPMRLYDPGLSGRRNLRPLEQRLRRSGELRTYRVGNIPLIVISARAALAAAEELAREGVYCYDLELQRVAR